MLLIASSFRERFGDGSLAAVLSVPAGSSQEAAVGRLSQLITLNQAGQTDQVIAVGKNLPAELAGGRQDAAAARAMLELAYSYQRAAQRHE